MRRSIQPPNVVVHRENRASVERTRDGGPELGGGGEGGTGGATFGEDNESELFLREAVGRGVVGEGLVEECVFAGAELALLVLEVC